MLCDWKVHNTTVSWGTADDTWGAHSYSIRILKSVTRYAAALSGLRETRIQRSRRSWRSRCHDAVTLHQRRLTAAGLQKPATRKFPRTLTATQSTNALTAGSCASLAQDFPLREVCGKKPTVKKIITKSKKFESTMQKKSLPREKSIAKTVLLKITLSGFGLFSWYGSISVRVRLSKG